MTRETMWEQIVQLRRENFALRRAVADLQIYAKRYADGRQTYAPGQVNESTRTLLALGIGLNPGAERIVWARDGGGRAYDRLTEAQCTPGTPEALGLDLMPTRERATHE